MEKTGKKRIYFTQIRKVDGKWKDVSVAPPKNKRERDGGVKPQLKIDNYEK